MPDKSNNRLILGGGAVGIVVVLGLVVYLLNKPIGPAPPPTDPQAARIEEALNALDRICLSNYSASEKAEVKAQVAPALKQITAGSSADHTQQVLRGASSTLSEAGQLQDGAAIRACMDTNLDKIFAAYQVGPAPSANAAGPQYPEPLETRLVAHFQPAAGASDKEVMVVLKGDGRIHNRDWIYRQPGSNYYHVDLGYPAPKETWNGVISAVAQDETPLTSHFAKICFRRPSAYASQQDRYILLNCEDGKVCALDPYSPKWVDICDPDAQTASASFWRGLTSVAYAEERPKAWSIPSLHTWRERSANQEGLGFTEFTVSTDAFAGKGVYGVEVGLAVDGQPVLEDGLKPDQRPEPYSGQGPFSYGFGLRSLDMRGRYAGCDRLELTLKPLIKGRATQPIKVSTDYAALRPLPQEVVRSTDGVAVAWSGVYRPPPKKGFENEVFLASISFGSVDDTAAQRRALDSATKLKTAFDALDLKFQDRLRSSSRSSVRRSPTRPTASPSAPTPCQAPPISSASPTTTPPPRR